MQLDRTEIGIRARSALELLDLSLLVLKRHVRPIALSSALLGLPLLLLDVLAVSWMLGEEALLAAEHFEYPHSVLRWRHSMHLVLLFVLQFPLISLPTTVFLGNRIFFAPLSLWGLLRRLWPLAWRCFFVLGVLRLGLLGLLLELQVDRSVGFDWLTEFWLLWGGTVVALFYRALWPFAPEILGLELCPLRARAPGEITYAARSRSLHRLLTSDHIARLLGSAFFGSLLFLTLIAAQLFVMGASSGYWQWNWWFDHVGLPVTMWVVGLFLAVFRFLAYLDSRIRLEGWEVELRLKAEAARLAEMATTKISTGTSQPSPAAATVGATVLDEPAEVQRPSGAT
ncbi:MAG: hypothetical protein KDA45_00145 [Planctomycetales bacterium]|nr:hypothetical protein [Planctomycetales bacterium]